MKKFVLIVLALAMAVTMYSVDAATLDAAVRVL